MLGNRGRRAGPLRISGVGENLVAGEFDGADLVLPAFEHVKLDVHRVRRRMVQLHVLDLKIEVAVVAVKIRQRVAVVVEVVLLEIPAAGQPGKHPAPPGLEFACAIPSA